MAEQILVVRTDELKQHVDFQGFLSLTEVELQTLYGSIEVLPLERDKAEHDPAFKQLVAYSVVRSGDRYLTYLRGKGQGEKRLHGNRSLGFGGHINSGDQANLFLDDHLKAAAFRELDEEIRVPPGVDLRVAGLINDDSNDVGKVHLGLVYVADLARPEVSKREKSITRIQFSTPAELVRDALQFETWSRHLIDNIEKLG